MTKLRIKLSQLFEVLFSRLDVAHLVSGFPQKVMSIADLPWLTSERKAGLSVPARLFVLLQVEVPVTKINVGIRQCARYDHLIENALDHLDALHGVADEQPVVSEVLVDRNA